MAFRLHEYCCRIWERDAADSNRLRPILLVVFYLGSLLLTCLLVI